jgi:hypothetical protein
VVVYQHVHLPLRYGLELVEKARLPLADTTDSLRDRLIPILSDPTTGQAVLSQAEPYIRDFACAYGDSAADNIVQHVLAAATQEQTKDGAKWT